MIQYLLILLSSTCAVAQSTLNKLGSNKGGVSPICFVFLKSFAAALLFFCLSIGSIAWHVPTVIYGLIYGGAMLFSNLFGYLALSKGSMAITSLLASYSIVIPCVFGVAYFHEKLEWYKYLGLAILAISMFLLRKKDKTLKFEKGWGFCIAMTFLSNGVFYIVQKLHQARYPGLYCRELSLVATVFMSLMFLIIVLAKREKIPLKAMKFSMPSGALMGFANFLSLVLSSVMNATVLFPLVTVSTVLLNCTVSKIMFKDKFSPLQILGIVLGVISVILMK